MLPLLGAYIPQQNGSSLSSQRMYTLNAPSIMRLHCISHCDRETMASLACLLSTARTRQPRATTGGHHCISRRERETLTSLACLLSETRIRQPRATTGEQQSIWQGNE